MRPSPRYPVYIPSKGRPDNQKTARAFEADGVPFRIVVEPSEVEAYSETWGAERVLSLPEDGRGLVYSRNWIKDHSVSEGHERHWQFDDDIRRFMRLHRGRRLPCSSKDALLVAEEFTDRYENVALTSFNSTFFVPASRGIIRQKIPPFYPNARCYTCFLVLNSLPNRWRYRYNEDTDMTLQVLAGGWCTVLFNALVTDSDTTMTARGGQTTVAYAGDGRLRMARQLQRVWPGVVQTRRRFRRPTHAIKSDWTMFDTPLRKRPGLDVGVEPIVDMKLVAVRDVRSERLADLLESERGRTDAALVRDGEAGP